MDNRIVFLIAGLILGYIFFSWLDKDSVIIETVTETKTDTVYQTVSDTIYITKSEIKHEVIRDTVLIEPIQPQIKAFTALKPFLHGNVSINGEVLGEVLKIDIVTDFKIPTITNTIHTKETIIKKPSGLFLTAGVSNNFSTPSIGAVFVKDRFLVGLNTGGFLVGYKVNR